MIWQEKQYLYTINKNSVFSKSERARFYRIEKALIKSVRNGDMEEILKFWAIKKYIFMQRTETT